MAKDNEPGKGSNAKKIIIWGLVVILLAVGASVAAILYFSGLFKNTEPASLTQSNPAQTSTAQNMPPQYVSLDPPFIVNLNDEGVLRYLQISVTVMTRDKKFADAITGNMPHIRNNLIFLFGKQQIEQLNTMEGKEKLRLQALEIVQEILRGELGTPGAEEVFFTNFVMQ